MTRVSVDGVEVEVAGGATILEAAEQAGSWVPTVCYDERQEPFGACRVCMVGVAGSPPADFGWLSRWNVDHGMLGMLPGIGLEQALRWNGIDVRDPATLARLHAQSPLAHAAGLRRPLALLAGGRDERVPIRAVVDYAARLRASGKPLTLLVEPEGAHSPRDPLPREGYLYVLETMLERHLGGAAPEPPGPALRAYLRDNLRLAGPEFAGVAPHAAR